VDCLSVVELRNIWRLGSRIRTWRDVRPEFPGAEIQLYGPGTDSGTYDFFTEAVVGELGASRTDFQASEDDNVLVQGVTGDRYALGFFGLDYLERNRERLGVVEVDNGDGCVQPSRETIRDGRYAPLTRDLFIYVKKASLGDEGVRAFLDYFMEHADSLMPEGFVAVSDSIYALNQGKLDRAAGASSPAGSPAREGAG
jgi:phosphate transport system substrate-binding protein